MAASFPNSPAGDDRNLIKVDENYLAPSFEDRMQMFWEKHSRTVIAVIVLVVIGIIAKGAFGYFAAQREAKIASEYAAANNTAQLQSFTQAYPVAALSGVAHLRLADEAYVAGSFSTAHVDYTAAVKILGDNPLATRARLGAALSLLKAGDAGAVSALQSVADDTKLSNGVRAEAAYHLALKARDAGKTADVTRWTELVLSTDSAGFWGQRAMQIRENLPLAETAPAPSTNTGTTSAVSGAK